MAKVIADYLADAEAKPVLEAWLQSESDKRVNAAIATHDKKNPPAGRIAAELSARLEKIEKAHTEYKASSELRYQVFKAATEAGIEYDVISDIPFKDLAEAEKKISQIASLTKQADIRVRNELLAGAHKPGSGNAPAGQRDPLDALPASERLAARIFGKLWK